MSSFPYLIYAQWKEAASYEHRSLKKYKQKYRDNIEALTRSKAGWGMKNFSVLSMSLGLIRVRPLIKTDYFSFFLFTIFNGGGDGRGWGVIFFGTRVIPGSRVISLNFFLRGVGGGGQESPESSEAFRICPLR